MLFQSDLEKSSNWYFHLSRCNEQANMQLWRAAHGASFRSLVATLVVMRFWKYIIGQHETAKI